jgi:MFS family permease
MDGRPAAERALVPLRRNRDFVLLQIGQALSTVGSEASGIAYTLLVLALTGSPAKAGLAAFARLVPYALFALPAGVASDRFNRKWLMIWADLVRVLALASLGVSIATGHVTFPQILIVAFVEGTMFVVFNIAEIGAVRSVVPALQLQRAFATEQARMSSVYLAGPSLGGALFGLARSLPFLVDAVSYAFSTGTLLAMRTPFQEDREESETAGIWTQIREGLAWLWGHAFLRTCALLFVGGNFLFGALELVLIVAAKRQGLSSAAIGALVAVTGAFSLLGSIAAPRFLRLLPMRAVLVLSAWLALGIVAFVIEPNVVRSRRGNSSTDFLQPDRQRHGDRLSSGDRARPVAGTSEQRRQVARPTRLPARTGRRGTPSDLSLGQDDRCSGPCRLRRPGDRHHREPLDPRSTELRRSNCCR